MKTTADGMPEGADNPWVFVQHAEDAKVGAGGGDRETKGAGGSASGGSGGGGGGSGGGSGGGNTRSSGRRRPLVRPDQTFRALNLRLLYAKWQQHWLRRATIFGTNNT